MDQAGWNHHLHEDIGRDETSENDAVGRRKKEKGIGSLYGEFAALEKSAPSYSSTAHEPMLHDNFPERARTALTARTRSSDVLPAFWRPIMVMSISVAQKRRRSQS